MGNSNCTAMENQDKDLYAELSNDLQQEKENCTVQLILCNIAQETSTGGEKNVWPELCIKLKT